jgi:hypothetical protein
MEMRLVFILGLLELLMGVASHGSGLGCGKGWRRAVSTSWSFSVKKTS